MPASYNNDYATCARTYAGFHIYHDDLAPDEITGLLGIQPTYCQIAGRITTRPGRKPFTAPIGLWSLSSKGEIDSRDVRRHLDWILERLAGKDDALKQLQDEGHRMDVSCYWLSAEGQGGPTLSPAIMRRLGELGIELWFDFYGPYD